jgi:hypothetical protein
MKDEALKLALEKIYKAREKVAALCEGKERWTMSVPVRSDYDHDVVISSALSMAEDAIKQALASPVQQESVWLCRSTKRTETGMYQAWQICSVAEAESHFDKQPNYEYKQFYTTPPAQPAPKNAGAAKMPCGAVVGNVYDAYEAGKKAAAQRQWIGIDDDDISALGLSIAKARALESLLKRRNT